MDAEAALIERQEQFRYALASLASGVSVVTCVGDSEVDHAMTASAVTSVSLDPPLVLACVSRTARFWEAISSVEHWAVSVLSARAQQHAQWLATPGRPLAGQLDRVPHRRSTRGYALLDESLAWLECTTSEVVRAGDHDIFIGSVDCATRSEANDPLLYWRREYYALEK